MVCVHGLCAWFVCSLCMVCVHVLSAWFTAVCDGCAWTVTVCVHGLCAWFVCMVCVQFIHGLCKVFCAQFTAVCDRYVRGL